jgi:hypothetical protein
VLAALSAATFAFSTLYRTDVPKREKKNPPQAPGVASIGVLPVKSEIRSKNVAGFTP